MMMGGDYFKAKFVYCYRFFRVAITIGLALFGVWMVWLLYELSRFNGL